MCEEDLPPPANRCHYNETRRQRRPFQSKGEEQKPHVHPKLSRASHHPAPGKDVEVCACT